ncbi:glycoside hydrolase family 20 protein [Xylaria cf. heliscus]|nr:glycoside hydrolase family 20 protein [Xylaria cf. heliscus]
MKRAHKPATSSTRCRALVSSSRLAAIPTIPFNASAGGGTYSLSSLKSIIVDSAYAYNVDKSGETTVPQTLHQFGGVFASNVLDIWGFQNISLPIGPAPQNNSIFLTLLEKNPYRYANGETSAEAYEMEVTPWGITVRGASPLGVWWGTRSLLQMAILTGGELPLGTVVDSPGWKIRGMMLDVARHYYPSEFIADICSYMSFFKQNTLQLHLSDNLYNNAKLYSREQSLGLYARFRLWSDLPEVAGLNKFPNESYTREDFRGMQDACTARGVTIIPEIEAPGHALPIVQWKPELGLSSDLSLLNLSHPDTLPTMKTIWGAFMDWFTCETVHLGADEYTGNVSEYNNFVNEMAEFIRNTGSKSVRIWGTFPPKPDYDNNISKDVSIQHWEFFEDNPLYDYIQNNYSVVNSDDTFYVVNKWSASYPQKVNIAKTFHGNPASGGPWEPYIFDTKNSTNNPDRSNKNVLGSIAPLWNDFGPNATVYSEAYYAWREGIPALADKQWGGSLLTEEFMNVLPILHPKIPGQFLENRIKSKGPEILRFEKESWAHARHPDGDDKVGDTWNVIDLSGNGYDAMSNCSVTPNFTIAFNTDCELQTELLSKGRNYQLTLRLYITHFGEDANIITGQRSALMLTPNITLFSSENYYRLNSTVPLYTWFDLSIMGLGERTFASIQEVRLGDPFVSRPDQEFQAVLGINGETLVWAPIAIEAPITKIWGSNAQWTGEFGGMLLTTDVS